MLVHYNCHRGSDFACFVLIDCRLNQSYACSLQLRTVVVTVLALY